MIVLVREPIQRALSQYTLETIKKPKKTRWNLTFEENVLTKDEEINTESPYIQRSMYYKHAKRWLEYFKLGNFLFLETDELKHNAVQALKKVEQFLGIKKFDWSRVVYFDKNRGFYCYKKNGENICLGNDKGVRHASIQPSTERKLQQYFRTQNELFFNLINERFNWTYH